MTDIGEVCIEGQKDIPVVIMEEVTMFYASDIWTKCPYCKERLDGFIGDPRNAKVLCDYCNKPFKIGADIDIDTY